jgi:hypothetical protein
MLTAGPPVARVLERLHSRVIKFLYTSYFVAYPLLFVARDALVASPAAGPVNVERGSAHTGILAPSLRPSDVLRLDAEIIAMFIRETRHHSDAFVHDRVHEFDDSISGRHVDPNDLRLGRQLERER